MSTLSIIAQKQVLPQFSENLTLAYKHLRKTEEGLSICHQLHALSNQLSELTKSNRLSSDNLKEITGQLITINQQIQDKKVTERFEKIAQIMAKLSGAVFPTPLPPAPFAAQEPLRKTDRVSTTASAPASSEPSKSAQQNTIEKKSDKTEASISAVENCRAHEGQDQLDCGHTKRSGEPSQPIAGESTLDANKSHPPASSTSQNLTAPHIADPVPTQPEAQVASQVANRLEKHNRRAFDLMPKANTPYRHYPHTPEHKASFLSLRTANRSPVKFSNGPFQDQIYSETRPLSSSVVNVACAQGRKNTMEDRFLAVTLHFQANGKTCSADLFGVFDGHGGSETVEFVISNLENFLQKQLERRLQDKAPNEDDIFYALREAVLMAHQQCVSKELRGGTTAIFGFKLTDSHEIWTANVGDSSAILDRTGEAIPMSIEQKPLYLPDSSVENAPSYVPNKYAKDLLKKDVFLNNGKNITDQELFEGKKMVMTSLGKDDENTHRLVLGIPNKLHLDMSRSIGDVSLDNWKKCTPEVFKQTLQPGDLLILHSDGVKALPRTTIGIIETEKQQGIPTKETLENLVQAAIRDKDNVCAMIVSFNEN
ncbi:MAG: protein serine/threonine phosphatase 2C family protein [Verrucomicrobia bacterium]|nr:protein serine/threonine phosphatase 2C family protein [Verrucomicrobiota bacterium]